MKLRVSPSLASSGCAASASSWIPESCFCGWADDDFPIILELCILVQERHQSHGSLATSTKVAAPSGSRQLERFGFGVHQLWSRSGPRMNLRFQSGSARSRLPLDAYSVSNLPSTCRSGRLWTALFNQIPHRPARLEPRFQFPAEPPVGKEYGSGQSVEASGKNGNICGFHHD